MSDIMTPIPFPKLMGRILQEHKKGSCDRQEALVPAAAQGCARLPTAGVQDALMPAAGPMLIIRT